MKKSALYALLSLTLAVFVLLGILFPEPALDYFIRPIGMIVWWIWRVLLSFDQQVFWCGLIFVAFAIAVRTAWLHQDRPNQEAEAGAFAFPATGRMEFWRALFMRGPEGSDFIVRNLLGLLVSVRASQEDRSSPTASDPAGLDRDLPKEVVDFLKVPSQNQPGSPASREWKAPFIHGPAWSRRSNARFMALIDQSLSVMEKMMEIQDHES